MKHALSFDLEEWYHPQAIRTSGLCFTPQPRAEAATSLLLDLLARYGVRATFFTVGETAEAHPRLMARLVAEGHEVGFHGWTHTPLWELTPVSFQAEVGRFLAWRDAHFPTTPILGYRAPTFSLDEKTVWAVQILREAGFAYDASIFPAATPLYGVADAPRTPYLLADEAGVYLRGEKSATPQGRPLYELPMSVFPFLGRRFGYTGGLYLRVLPYQGVAFLLKRARRPALFYIHPWEADAGTPRLPLSRWGRFVLYSGLPVLHKLERLLRTFQFGTVTEVYGLWGIINADESIPR